MTTEVLLTRTKDNYVIAFTITYGNSAEKSRLKHECENLCQTLNYNEFRSNMISSPAISFDAANTNFLRREISGYHYRKNRADFSNGMSTIPVAAPDTLSPYSALNDDFFPEMIKNLGFKINPVDKTYEMRYDAANGVFVAQNFVKTTATVTVSERKLDIVRNHFHFLPEDYRRLRQLQDSYRTAKQTNRGLTEEKYAQNVLTDKKDRALFWFYSQQKKNASHLGTTIAHELKHIENDVFEDGLSLKKNSKRQTVENMYRIAVENERSAYLRELVQNINTYLQNGRYGDFSMFHNNNVDFVNKLKRLRSQDERIAYATNWPQMLAEKMNDFEIHHRKSYDYGPENVVLTDADKDRDGDSKLRQFLQTTKSYVKNAPLNSEEDTDGTEFRKLRSLFYNYKIYNPTTHRMEDVNLAQYITPDLEVKIDDRIRREIIEPQQNRLNDRLRDFATERAQGAINTALIEPAKSIMRGGVVNSAFVNMVENFRIASLYEPEDTPTPPPPVVNTPDNRADWSNGLKDYWSGMEGYQEIAKNNEEYKFKIKEATVSYSSPKDVKVSKKADYELYVKLLKEPSTQNAPIEFLSTLSKEQALLLYIACINNGRHPVGAVPTDFSGIDRLQGVSPLEINKFRHRMQQSSTSAPSANSQQRQQTIPPVRQRVMSGKAQNTY